MPMFFLSPLAGLIPDDLRTVFGFPEILAPITRVKANPLPRLNLIQIGQAGNKNCLGVFGHDIKTLKENEKKKTGIKLPDDAARALEFNPACHKLAIDDIAVIVKRDAEHVVQVVACRVTINQYFFFHFYYSVFTTLRKSSKRRLRKRLLIDYSKKHPSIIA